MKRIATVMTVVAAGTVGAVTLAEPVGSLQVPDAFGTPAEALFVDDVWVDAERVFEKVDVNRDGVIDVDEYAAQAVVYAGLARLNGLVAVDGRDTVHVGLPHDGREELGLAERTAIDAVARNDYYAVTAERGAMTPRTWVTLQIERFAEADRNEDGQLTGRELTRYAMQVARYEVTSKG